MAAGTLRLFIAFTLPASVIDQIVLWQDRELAGSGVRVLSADHLHITLVFLGNRPAADVELIAELVRRAAASNPQPAFTCHRYHETSRVGMIRLREMPVAGEHFTGRANQLVGRLMRALEERQMYRPEYRGWVPHVSVARFRESPHLRPPPPDLGVFSPPDIVLFQSVTTPSGSNYEPLVTVPMAAGPSES